jgi:glycosyltransferase involved in cell wall biosynthesis
MAYGRPLALFDLTEGRRAAGDAALYARPNDPQDLAEKILQLLDSEALRRELGERGRKRVQERFNWEFEAKALLEAYEAALA